MRIPSPLPSPSCRSSMRQNDQQNDDRRVGTELSRLDRKRSNSCKLLNWNSLVQIHAQIPADSRSRPHAFKAFRSNPALRPMHLTATGKPRGSRIPPRRCASPWFSTSAGHWTCHLSRPRTWSRVSADNRFILYVNGKRVGDGPARGDLTHWRYERFDLAPYLQQGQNLITATVWNFGVFAPVAQMSDRTAFLLESEATGATGHQHVPIGWLVEDEPGHRPLDRTTVTSRPTSPPVPAKKSTPRNTTGIGTPPPPAQTGFPPPHPMRDSIFSGPTTPTPPIPPATISGDLIPDELPHMEYSPTAAGDHCRLWTHIANEQQALATFPNRDPASVLPAIACAHPPRPQNPHHRLPRARRLRRQRLAHLSSLTPKPSTTRTSTKATAIPFPTQTRKASSIPV